MLDTADRIAVALQVLQRRNVLDFEAIGALLSEVHPPDVVERGIVRGVGVVCSADVCAAWGEVSEPRRHLMRTLLEREGMADLLER